MPKQPKQKKFSLSQRGKRLVSAGIRQDFIEDAERELPTYGSMLKDGSSVQDMREAMTSGQHTEDEILKLLGTRGLEFLNMPEGSMRPYDTVPQKTSLMNDKWKFAPIGNDDMTFHCYVRRSYTLMNGGYHGIGDYPERDQIFVAKERSTRNYAVFRVAEVRDFKLVGAPCTDVVIEKLSNQESPQSRGEMVEFNIQNEKYYRAYTQFVNPKAKKPPVGVPKNFDLYFVFI